MIKILQYREPIVMENWLVNADELGTISEDWLILDSDTRGFDVMMTTVIHLDSVKYFVSSKRLSSNDIFLIDAHHPDGYLY